MNASDVKPGDLIFFQGTYDTSGASHVGIVVDPVNTIMIHCGNPIQYASYDSNYWRQHFYCFWRVADCGFCGAGLAAPDQSASCWLVIRAVVDAWHHFCRVDG